MNKFDTIAKFLLSQGCTIFGGYVRDIIAGDEPKDIDVLCRSKDFLESTIQRLSTKYFVKHSKVFDSEFYDKKASGYGKNAGFIHRRLQLVEFTEPDKISAKVSPDGTVLLPAMLQVDLVVHQIPQYFKPDADVNRLSLSRAGLEFIKNFTDEHAGTTYSFPHTLLDVLDNIKKRQFRAPPGIEQKRIDKMLKKGYNKL